MFDGRGDVCDHVAVFHHQWVQRTSDASCFPDWPERTAGGHDHEIIRRPIRRHWNFSPGCVVGVEPLQKWTANRQVPDAAARAQASPKRPVVRSGNEEDATHSPAGDDVLYIIPRHHAPHAETDDDQRGRGAETPVDLRGKFAGQIVHAGRTRVRVQVWCETLAAIRFQPPDHGIENLACVQDAMHQHDVRIPGWRVGLRRCARAANYQSRHDM